MIRFHLALGLCVIAALGVSRAASPRPNILFAISDDHSFPYASAYGVKGLATPAFDRVARDGVLFMNAFAAAPGCSPARASILTGRHIWQLEDAGSHAAGFPTKFVTVTDLLEGAGYFIGYTGKPWSPGDWKASGRTRNPVGPAFNRRTLDRLPPGVAAQEWVAKNDYAENFRDFLETRTKGAPFFFWYGGNEPHRIYDTGSGVRAGRSLADVHVPSFLPDAPEMRSDLLDYQQEIEYFDSHLGRMLALLEKSGELANTIVFVTADNGMPFPRAKANLYEYGTHLPLAISWPRGLKGGRVVQDLISMTDLAPTLLEIVHLAGPREHPMSGRSFAKLLTSDRSGLVEPERDAIYTARERHSIARWQNQPYPARAIRTHDFLYIRNLAPDRWPAGDPQLLDAEGKINPRATGFLDIDDFGLSYVFKARDNPEVASYFALATAKRPAEELFDIRRDPGCIRNLAGEPEHQVTLRTLRSRLEDHLRKTGDPRMSGSDSFEHYPSYGRGGRTPRRFPPPEGH